MSRTSGLCPNCGNRIIFEDGEQTTVCFACDGVINVSEISGKNASSSNSNSYGGGYSAGAIAPAALMGFDNSESGIVFIENFFDNYDWTEYQKNNDIEIDELEEVVNNNKMKNGAVPASWYLDYKALAVPVRKKIEGLAETAKAAGAEYNPEDPSASYVFFDVYNDVCRKLVCAKESVLKRLEYATKYGLEKERLAEIQADFADLKARYENDVKVVTEIDEIPEYAQAVEVVNERARHSFADLGIEAESVYQDAMAKFNDASPNKKAALVQFEKIRGYRDSSKKIAIINRFFGFKGETLYRCFGKHFIAKEEVYTPTLNVQQLGKKNKEGEEAQPQGVKSLSLYEVVENGMPAKEPIVKGIVKMLACYGGKLYYIKEKEGICSYDLYDKTEVVVEASERELYLTFNGYEYDVIDKGRKFYIKKKKKEKAAALGKSGCGSKKKDAAPAPAEPAVVEDFYDILVVDMVSGTASVVVDGLQEIVKKDGDKIFYTRMEEETSVTPAKGGCGAKATTVTTQKAVLYVCDLATGFKKALVDDACKLKAAHEDKIVYTKLKPNDYNQDLYVYDIHSGKETLIEENVYGYFGIFKNKIYYLVGNAQFCPLVRNNFEGTQREQFMKNVERIVDEIGGWLYVKKGRAGSYNSTLVKVNLETKKRVTLCTQFKKIATFYGNYVYYVDVENNLRSVRIDGKHNVCVAKDVREVYPTPDYLYYTRVEDVNVNETALSLYRMDKDGDNIKKIVFNVDAVCNDFATEKLYFEKVENMMFKCYMPGKEKEATVEVHQLKKFYVMNKENEKIEHVLTLGYPSEKMEKAGCLGKKKEEDKIFEEIGLFTQEIVNEIEQAAAAEENAPATSAVPGCGGASANKAPAGGSAAGCGNKNAAAGGNAAAPGCGAKK